MANSAKKELSAGTLNLKFMARASHDGPPIPSLAKKKVTDEGEWDIGPDVRRALGISGTPLSSGPAQEKSSSVTYEPSYMPFITGPDVKGRFSFKDGIRQEDPNPSDDVPVEEESHTDGSSSNPKAISLSSGQPAKPRKLVRSASSQPVIHLPTRPATFVRPAGVDPAPPSNVGRKKRVVDTPSNSHTPTKRESSSSLTTGTSPQKKKKKKSHLKVDISS